LPRCQPSAKSRPARAQSWVAMSVKMILTASGSHFAIRQISGEDLG
jgi:hypothetical protein